jgi:hypothetical protein
MKFIWFTEPSSSLHLRHSFSECASLQGKHHENSSVLTISNGFDVSGAFASCWVLTFQPVFGCLKTWGLGAN